MIFFYFRSDSYAVKGAVGEKLEKEGILEKWKKDHKT